MGKDNGTKSSARRVKQGPDRATDVAEEVEHAHVDDERTGAIEKFGDGSCRHADYGVGEETQHKVLQRAQRNIGSTIGCKLKAKLSTVKPGRQMRPHK
jgi:hypothetical protein